MIYLEVEELTRIMSDAQESLVIMPRLQRVIEMTELGIQEKYILLLGLDNIII